MVTAVLGLPCGEATSKAKANTGILRYAQDDDVARKMTLLLRSCFLVF